MIKLRISAAARFNTDPIIEVTDEQYDSMVKLIKRYRKEPDEIWTEWGSGALMCEFDGLVVGIEKDGLAHS
jgi:hypothetical protein